MISLCNNEEKHRVDTGASYHNDHGCDSFLKITTTDLKENLKKKNKRFQVFC